eukprot:jgi/Undpi1/11859/HiC_scaffold_4.g01558.m1
MKSEANFSGPVGSRGGLAVRLHRLQACGQMDEFRRCLNCCSKIAMQDYFDNTWTLTESLFSSLQGEEAFMTMPAHGLRHPLIFYYGHPASLYVNKLRAAGIIQAPINAHFEALLETGVDEMNWDVVGDDNMMWPSVFEVLSYRRDVYKLVCEVIARAPDEAIANITMDSPYWALPMAMEHERIHIETSSVLIRELPLDYVAQPASWPEAHPGPNPAAPQRRISNPLVQMEKEKMTLGKPRDFPSYGWDCEYGSREFEVPSFEASKHMVSNGEYMEFVKDAGYARQELWSEIGWKWKMFRNVKHPQFWVPEGPSGLHQYRLRTMFDEVPLPWDWPALVNYHEAKAFATWKTLKEEQDTGDQGKAYRLITELEHNLIRGSKRDRSNAEKPEVIDPVLSAVGSNPLSSMANTNLVSGSESPVDHFLPNEKGFHDVLGSAWEWCEDRFSALNGFAISPLYEDFATPCFDGEHHLIVGGSFASTGNEASVFARFHFRPHFHQHAGFRLVACDKGTDNQELLTSCTDAPPPYVGSYPYRTSAGGSTPASRAVTREQEARQSLAANLAMHYAAPAIADDDPTVAQGLRYPQRCAQVALRALDGVRPANELEVVEVGCGAGGASFELSKVVGKVVALDGSKPLIDTATKMARDGMLVVECPSTRGSSQAQEVSLAADANPERVTFRQCDPMCLPAGLAGLDAALIHSVIDAIPSPNSLLSRMGGARGVVRANGGLVIVVSGYDWNEDTTPRGGWLGGNLDDNGNMVASVHGISKGLGGEFKLVHVEQVPSMRPLSDRVFEYASAQATVWRRD